LKSLLKNKTVLITRSAKSSKEAIDLLLSTGAVVIFFPTLEIKTMKNPRKFYSVVQNFNEIDFLVFTSVNAVNSFVKLINKKNIKIKYNKCKVAAVGAKTAEACKKNNIHIDIVPDKFSAKGMINHFNNYDIKNSKFLIPGSKIARTEFKDFLTSMGATVYQVPIYTVSLPDSFDNKNTIKKLKNKKPDIFIFTSPSTYKNFLKMLNINNPELYFKNKVVTAIGPSTSKAIENSKVKVDIVPQKFTIKDSVEAVINYFTN